MKTKLSWSLNPNVIRTFGCTTRGASFGNANYFIKLFHQPRLFFGDTDMNLIICWAIFFVIQCPWARSTLPSGRMYALYFCANKSLFCNHPPGRTHSNLLRLRAGDPTFLNPFLLTLSKQDHVFLKIHYFRTPLVSRTLTPSSASWACSTTCSTSCSTRSSTCPICCRTGTGLPNANCAPVISYAVA